MYLARPLPPLDALAFGLTVALALYVAVLLVMYWRDHPRRRTRRR